MSDVYRNLCRAAAGLALACLVGCVARPTVKIDTALAPDDRSTGFLLVTADRKWADSAKTGKPLLELLYRKGDAVTVDLGAISFFRDTTLVLQQLPVGEYNIYNSYFGIKHMSLPKVGFRILPGQITYVGDFNITVNQSFISPLTERKLVVTDKRESAMAKLSVQYPVIAKMYSVRSEVTSFSKTD
jgi:hypothetical protein